MPERQVRHGSSTTLIIASSLLIFCIVCSRITQSTAINNEWDILIFTQSWPVTVCLRWKENDRTNVCIPPEYKNSWTIHGIWPTKYGTKGPNFCDNSLPFDLNELNSIEKDLIKFWTPIEERNQYYDFWRYQWEKHGTCAAQLEALRTQYSYFSQALHWRKEYNMRRILKQAGIAPGSNDLEPIEIIHGVQDVLGVRPYVSCYKERKTKKVHLFEVRLCFDKNLNLIDCNTTSYNDDSTLTDCPLDRYIDYPLEDPGKPIFDHEDLEDSMYNLKMINFIQRVKLHFSQYIK